MKTIAITGGIACGKSTVAAILQREGVKVLDTDEVAHSLMAPSGKATAALAEIFGKAILDDTGAVDRRSLGAIVFSDAAALEKLNAVTHPLIAEEVSNWVSSQDEKSICAVLVPLLYESKFDARFSWDEVVAVICSKDEQIRRVCGRGFSKEEALARIEAQMSCEEKAARADYVIQNDGSISALENDVKRVLSSVIVS